MSFHLYFYVLFWIFYLGCAQTSDDETIWDVTKGLFPNVFNLAATSVITANATCGETGPEVYCKLVEHVFRSQEQIRSYPQTSIEPQCSVCDKSSIDKQHPISNAIDGTNQWWQSPTLQHGKQFEWITVTIDLGQIYQVAYVILKSAISPRPGNWILERSLDGIVYKPWQYYALSDRECWETYGIRPTVGKPRYRTDDEVICTSFYSKLQPLENGEVHSSLVNGRPGADKPTEKLREFTKARYVRLRLQKIRTLNADLMSLLSDDSERSDESVTRRYFYSIKDISIGGQCMCSGHASKCVYDETTGKQHCRCQHNTCGTNCERCCPLFNQIMFRPGNSLDAAICQKCECYGHSDSCHFDAKVAAKKSSLNADGLNQGGGVCDNCKHFTSGNNCEQCQDGYFRPAHISRNHTKPCRKCQCNGPGMTSICVKDNTHIIEGLNRSVLNFNLVSPLVQLHLTKPGDCLCKVGFEGKKCDRCSIGYRNFPVCEPCPCHSAGTFTKACEESECVCKAHVEGSRCDRCKRGFFHLSADNPDGCSQCFCFGLTDECIDGDYGINVIEKLEDWRVTDLKGKKTIRPIFEKRDAVVANDDMSQFSTYYWLAPPDYLGKKLYSYGADLKFSISYVVARGDTSGTYTESADVIIEGNNMQLGYNFAVRPELDSMKIVMPLREQGWFVLDRHGNPDGPVSREDFTLVLNDLTRLLIRAKFHSDQIEGRLHDIGMETAVEESKSFKKLKSVEKCICPPGYVGLSCEACALGYRAVKDNSLLGFSCKSCDCYNHAESCDDTTGACINCIHNTIGIKCNRCEHGYYGNATIGTPNDCKQCACPLEQSENNFSPSCVETVSSTGEKDYICDQCPYGYEGQKCEKCADGYFGNPQILGGFCQPCDCKGNADIQQTGWCDSLTGQCRKCLGNTGGWNCDECLPNHYGDPEHLNCKPCLCSPQGSINMQCDQITGQCLCKTHFVGKTCDRCAEGYGNIESECVPCKCNKVGSKSEICDAISGQCFCNAGVFGETCDYCLENHYGFSHHGCRECNCDLDGSISAQCDENTGQCTCKPQVVGLTCDRCDDGYWNLHSRLGCEQCHCNRTGSVASVCEKSTGRCSCKRGIGGNFCDTCLPGYFMYSSRGCRQCDPCDAPNHICDPTTGRCVCPPYTTGRQCQSCVRNAWGYDARSGCKPCNCNPQGSPNQICDQSNGNCICLESFVGHYCDQCRHGFYNFPNCHKCDCNVAGVDPAHCQLKDGVCQCNEHGHCFCKENVAGPKCDKCQEDAFGLSSENIKGCHKCFCFGRTKICNQANMYWTKINFPSQDIFTEVGVFEIPSILGFKVIPQNLEGHRLGIPYVLDKPLYWSLPKDNLGNKVLSYNGYLTFHVESHSASHFPEALLHGYPLVILQGNQRVVLIHSHTSSAQQRPYRIKLNENEWRNWNNPQVPVSKDVLMVALQNLQTILIRATDGPDFKYSRLYNVTLDMASSDIHGVGSSLAEGIELCRCPKQYSGTSCEDPSPGYYRKRKPKYLDSKDILDLVGWAEPCNCNNHTAVCDRETGVCINCGGNTVGDYCDQCKKGYYGHPRQGPCRPCSCPLINNSFSDTCIPDASDYICVNCQTGYIGRHCESCEKGFYGNPLLPNGRCIECKCNPYGSIGRDCDQITGQCRCQDGISGRDCTVCSHGFILTEYGCKSCEDECTGLLLGELFDMKIKLQDLDLTDLPKLPWIYLKKMTDAEKQFRPLVDDYQKLVADGKDLINNFTFYFDLESQADGLFVKAKDFVVRAVSISADAKTTLEEAEKLFHDLNRIWRNMKDLASELDKHGMNLTGPALSTERMLMAAEAILQELKERYFPPYKEGAERELRKAHALIDKLNQLTSDRGHIDVLQEKLNVLDKLLKDIVQKINQDVQRNVDRTRETTRGGRLRLNEVQDALAHIADVLQMCNSTLKEAADILVLARGFAIDASIKFEYLPKLLRELENITNSLEERRGILSSLNPIYKNKHVIPCQNHADALERESRRLADLFTATKELSEFPLQAANAYQNIVDAINNAERAAEAADRAADKAYEEAYPTTDDALIDQAKKAKERSLKLLAEARELNEEDVPELEVALRARKQDLTKLSDDVAYGKRKNDLINRDLDLLPVGTGRDLKEVNRKIGIAGERAEGANTKVDRLNKLISTEIKPKYEALHAGTVGGLENITRMIERARGDVREASRLADSADASNARIRRLNAQLQLNLKDLKDKILLARQRASSIRVSVTTDPKKKCFRSYKPIIEPSTTNTIVLNYAIDTGAPDSLIFFIGNAREEDFMAVEMFNRKIRFLWNVGGGTQVLQHNKTIETDYNQLLNNWYRIEVNRIGNVATLSVKKTSDGLKVDPYEVSASSIAGFTKMHLDSTASLFIGGFPENYFPPSELLTSTFAGCLYTLEFDGKLIGLWNFLSSIGCDGCKEGATEDIDIGAYELQGGSSYSIVPQNPYYRKSDLYTVMNFRTLNEDGLLFFSSNPKTGHFISLELKKGKVVYQLKFGGDTQIYIETKKKYNNGEWTRVEAAREKNEAQILVEEELLEEKSTKHGSWSLDLADSPLYYGGIPPNFTKESWPGVTFKSFFGCFRDLQMDSTPIALSRGSFYGMTIGCSNKALKVCTFFGGGYLELNGQPLVSDSSFSFSFFTHQTNAILMLSSFVGQGQYADEENYYSVSLKDGRIVMRLNSDSGGEISLISDTILSTSTFHTITFIRKNRRLLLRIDDVQEADFRLSGRAKDVSSPQKGGLFFGGVRDGISFKTAVAASEQSFAGIIQDVIFNGRLLRFDEAVGYKNVDFGSTDVSFIEKELFQQMAVSEPDNSCSSSIDGGIDGDAFSPTNTKHGFLIADVSKKDLFRNFNITLAFRTYYPDGILLFSKNDVKRQELVMYLKNGSIVIELKRKSHVRNLHSSDVNIGQWNKVEFIKSDELMSLVLNGNTSSIDIFKKFSLKSPIFVGGVPKKIYNTEIASLYGCLKSFYVNDALKQLPSAAPCFKHSQQGNYFSGDSFVIYDSAYYLSNIFMITLEFRTQENLDVDLVYIYSNDAKITFRIEIIDSQVLATLYSVHDKQKIQLSRKLETQEERCAKQNWHFVKFSYQHGNLSLQLDDSKHVDKTLRKTLPPLNYVEVYIGGSPNKYGKESTKNYIGCLRNIAINDELLDLRNAEDNQNIHHSCPSN